MDYWIGLQGSNSQLFFSSQLYSLEQSEHGQPHRKAGIAMEMCGKIVLESMEVRIDPGVDS